jgi:acyl carrier protein
MPDSMVQLVIQTINKVLVDKGRPVSAALTTDTDILADTQLDSLGLAEVVVRLENETGRFPFAGGFVRFTTVGELADLYAAK